MYMHVRCIQQSLQLILEAGAVTSSKKAGRSLPKLKANKWERERGGEDNGSVEMLCSTSSDFKTGSGKLCLGDDLENNPIIWAFQSWIEGGRNSASYDTWCSERYNLTAYIPVLVRAARGWRAESRLWREPWVSLYRSTGPLSSKGSIHLAARAKYSTMTLDPTGGILSWQVVRESIEFLPILSIQSSYCGYAYTDKVTGVDYMATITVTWQSHELVS